MFVLFCLTIMVAFITIYIAHIKGEGPLGSFVLGVFFAGLFCTIVKVGIQCYEIQFGG